MSSVNGKASYVSAGHSDIADDMQALGAQRNRILSLPLSNARTDGALTVMIVEDEALIAFDLEDLFEDEGFAIAGPFGSCANALRSLKASLPDVAVLDATLSDGPCLEVALELRRRGVPFMIYSGRVAAAECPPELDGVPWVEKPGSSEAVLNVVKKLTGTGTAAMG